MQGLERLGDAWAYLVELIARASGYLLGFDPRPVLPWFQFIAAVLAIIASGWALYNLWNHLNLRRRRLLRDYLTDEQKKILEQKTGVSARFQNRVLNTEKPEILDIHARINRALRLFDSGNVKSADKVLKELMQSLKERKELADQQSQVAHLETGAIHLFLGSIAASQDKMWDAIKEFKAALEVNEKDLDALKYLGEQHLRLSEKEPQSRESHLIAARDRFKALQKYAGEANYQQRESDAFLLLGRAHVGLEEPDLARIALDSGATIADRIHDHHLLSAIKELSGDVALSREPKHWNVAIDALEVSHSSYLLIGDHERAATVAKKLDRARKRGAEETGDKSSERGG